MGWIRQLVDFVAVCTQKSTNSSALVVPDSKKKHTGFYPNPLEHSRVGKYTRVVLARWNRRGFGSYDTCRMAGACRLGRATILVLGSVARAKAKAEESCTFTGRIWHLLGSFKVSIMYTIICPIRYLIIRSGVQ